MGAGDGGKLRPETDIGAFRVHGKACPMSSTVKHRRCQPVLCLDIDFDQRIRRGLARDCV
jgi:hypothetical protein